ncbi:uncharacterized protein AMSG_08219 [Thecamonas trahens ATCC 50062]|uniref:Uncharacterized protein n=1 Tax=Thecamonas trahens ATCC 50062 TaxID=461836 RepID=A0A0L0DIN4_THETB|nr:hypothetical protein AMSG_08219 [Thecamonas trahens ATCC 50062]KNC51971.1 hypothetical protein AMSG_08219 [Thecamonas trahens ATCC 50062]|eukprot:XP_013755558.1 hypothetical protein AMSG_08219 [Thecamonas trahens ATCC 50062]
MIYPALANFKVKRPIYTNTRIGEPTLTHRSHFDHRSFAGPIHDGLQLRGRIANRRTRQGLPCEQPVHPCSHRTSRAWDSKSVTSTALIANCRASMVEPYHSLLSLFRILRGPTATASSPALVGQLTASHPSDLAMELAFNPPQSPQARAPARHSYNSLVAAQNRAVAIGLATPTRAVDVSFPSARPSPVSPAFAYLRRRDALASIAADKRATDMPVLRRASSPASGSRARAASASPRLRFGSAAHLEYIRKLEARVDDADDRAVRAHLAHIAAAPATRGEPGAAARLAEASSSHLYSRGIAAHFEASRAALLGAGTSMAGVLRDLDREREQAARGEKLARFKLRKWGE